MAKDCVSIFPHAIRACLSHPSFLPLVDCGGVNNDVLLRNDMLPSNFSALLLGNCTSNDRKCSFVPFSRVSSESFMPVYRIRPSLIARFASPLTESVSPQSISAMGSTLGAREVKSKRLILFLTPLRPAPPPPPTTNQPGRLLANVAAKIGYEAAMVSLNCQYVVLPS